MRALARLGVARRRRRGAATNPAPGRVTVGELARGGLGRYPTAIGVYWPREQVVVCRGHVTSTGHRKAMARHRSPGDEAIVLVSSPDGARKLRRECVHCKETGR